MSHLACNAKAIIPETKAAAAEVSPNPESQAVLLAIDVVSYKRVVAIQFNNDLTLFIRQLFL